MGPLRISGCGVHIVNFVASSSKRYLNMTHVSDFHGVKTQVAEAKGTSTDCPEDPGGGDSPNLP